MITKKSGYAGKEVVSDGSQVSENSLAFYLRMDAPSLPIPYRVTLAAFGAKRIYGAIRAVMQLEAMQKIE